MRLAPYGNLDGDSGVTAYRTGPGFILVRFVDGATYLYTDAATGARHVRHMQRLAETGRGLATYINRNVRGRYACRLH